MADPATGRRPPGAARFEDRGEIARGGMGSVHALWDHLLGRRVALKQLWREGDDAAAEQFTAEARTMGGLDHPNILPVYDLEIDPTSGHPRLLMKLVEGRTLRALLAEMRVPPTGAGLESLLDAVLKVCDAVSFAHSRGVLHRDIHPGNVMVGSHGQVYVMDWGLAIRREDAQRLAAPPSGFFGSGTPAYMAPEQAWGRYTELDERTDVFGIGALLYELLTLQPPFPSRAVGEVLEQARRCRVVPPELAAPGSDPPARLCDIVMRALSKDRADRHQSVQALRDDLQDFLRSGGWFPAQRFASGADMLREGDLGDRAFIVTQGTCEVFRMNGDRVERLRTVGPGGVVGEVGLFTASPRVATVRALTEVTALVVTREALERELGRASWMRAFVEAAIARFVELDELQRPGPRAE